MSFILQETHLKILHYCKSNGRMEETGKFKYAAYGPLKFLQNVTSSLNFTFCHSEDSNVHFSPVFGDCVLKSIAKTSE